MPTVDTADRELLALKLSVLRAHHLHWLDAHPPLPPVSWWEALLDGFASLVGPLPPRPRESAQVRLQRCWATAAVKVLEQVAEEKGIELLDVVPDDLPWWDALLAVRTMSKA